MSTPNTASNNTAAPTVESAAKTTSVSIIPSIAARQFTPDMRAINPATGNVYKSKGKPQLGVAEDREIVWCWPNFTLVEKQRFLNYARLNNLEVAELGAKIVMDWYSRNEAEILKTIAGHTVGEVTAEKVAQIAGGLDEEGMTKLMAELNAKIDAMKKLSGR